MVPPGCLPFEQAIASVIVPDKHPAIAIALPYQLPTIEKLSAFPVLFFRFPRVTKPETPQGARPSPFYLHCFT
ncbi:hypothetical protein [Phormidium sp. CCY1219]|uniref:hypothetical protein n=1 Tax=Phormidium sp. CCY1219 TaxID=2886104 RepID=UPI002D1EAA1A|nr:hypothetical protein [Phormidium sp. CCY1219]MEB3830977.1 hypothetical protein [Phormidium sp. CCY1219]